MRTKANPLLNKLEKNGKKVNIKEMRLISESPQAGWAVPRNIKNYSFYTEIV
jgi:hypothetical protein